MADRTTTTQQRAPLFYCYECNAEMRPLMMPDPHCASCHGTFVEEIPSEPSQDATHVDNDPRHFQVDPLGGAGPNDGDGGLPPFGAGGDPIIQLMNALMGGLAGANPPRNFPGAADTGSGNGNGSDGGGGMSGGASPFGASRQTTIRFDMSGGRGRVFFTSGGSPGLGPGTPLGGGGTPSASGAPPTQGNRPPTHPLEGLLALLTGRPPGAGGPLGDYVWDQQGLDEIITRLMEQNQGNRAVPAPEDMIRNFPRTKVTADSPLVEKECAVCKDTFEPSETNPVVTLPCSDNPKYQHSFHEDCIVPWFQQSATCPVCRHQFVPQPEHGAAATLPITPTAFNPNQSRSRSASGGSNASGSSIPSHLENAASGIRQGVTGLYQFFTGHGQQQGGGSPPSQQLSSANPDSSSTSGQQGQSNNQTPPRSGPAPPGGWDTLD